MNTQLPLIAYSAHIGGASDGVAIRIAGVCGGFWHTTVKFHGPKTRSGRLCPARFGGRVRNSDGVRAYSAQSVLRFPNSKNAFVCGRLVSGQPCLRLVFSYCGDRSPWPQRFVPARPRRLALREAAIVHDALDGTVASSRAGFLGVLCAKAVANCLR